MEIKNIDDKILLTIKTIDVYTHEKRNFELSVSDILSFGVDPETGLTKITIPFDPYEIFTLEYLEDIEKIMSSDKEEEIVVPQEEEKEEESIIVEEILDEPEISHPLFEIDESAKSILDEEDRIFANKVKFILWSILLGITSACGLIFKYIIL